MKFITSLGFLIPFTFFAQQELIIVDCFSGEPMPFVKALPQNSNPVFSDIDGYISVPESTNKLTLRFLGYHDTIIDLKIAGIDTICLEPKAQILQEVVVKPGENRAHRIINEAIARKKENHPLRNDAFTYESYSKFVFDPNDVFKERLKKSKEKDSLRMKASNFIENQHLFLIESASERKFIPPTKDREDITAYRVSGLNLPIFSTFAQSAQSFHFYDDEIALSGKKYISPLSSGATRRYLFQLEDTTFVGSDTTFTISYRPQKGKSFDGLEGLLYITTNGFAVEKVIAEPYSDSESPTHTKIVQEYTLVDGKKWFPNKLSTEINFRIAEGSSGGNENIQGIGHTYIENVQLNPEGLRKRGFGNVSISTNIGAENTAESVWEEKRIAPISEKEKSTYQKLDSLAKEHDLDRMAKGFLALTTGKFRIKPVNICLDRLLDFNRYEGLRLGVGLETSDLVLKNATIGGYFAYGIRDKDWKYGGYTSYFFNRRKGLELTARYQQDLLHRGGYDFTPQSGALLTNSTLQDLFRSYMERQRLAELKLSYSPLGNLHLHVAGNYQRIEFMSPYEFVFEQDPENGIAHLDVAETSLEIQWNIREKVMLLGSQVFSEGTKFPRVTVKVAKGWKGIGRASLDYIRMNLNVQQTLLSKRWGGISWAVTGGQTFGEVPLYLKQLVIGTRQDWNVEVLNTFQTAFPGEFYHDRQAALFFKYTFPRIHTKANWNEPQFALYHGLGVGDFATPNQHTFEFETMHRGFTETGLILNNMFTSDFYGIGLGGFYRYGAYSNSDWRKNIVPKITLSFIF